MTIRYTESVADQEYINIEDQEKPEEVLSLNGERSYTIEQLLRAIPQIDVIREYTVIHYERFLELREVKRYSLNFDKRKRDNIFTAGDFSRLFGNRAEEVFRLLCQYGYAEKKHQGIHLRTKLQVATFEDFFLGRSREFERIVFSGLVKLLKKELELKKDGEGNWTTREAYLLYDKRATPVPQVHRSSKNYIFRIGNRFLYVDFFYIPSQELLELIQLRLTLVFQEQMENFFQIISSFSIERDAWQKGQDRRKRFKEVLENLFSDAWTLFDLDFLSLQIHSWEGEYQFAKGSFSCYLNEEGEMTWSCHSRTEELPALFDLSREFLARNIQLVYSQITGDPVTMDIYMRSRSVNNIDPRTSVLLHSFIKLLKEAIIRVIETVIPILQMEEANRTLRRHLFLESLRVRNRSCGENINRIIDESVAIIRWVFSVREVYVYSGSPEFLKMIRIFQDQERNRIHRYVLRETPLSLEEKRQGNLLEISVLEQIGENLNFYFKIPMEKEEEGYLAGTPVERIIRSVLTQYGLTWPNRGLDMIADWTLSTNSGVVTTQIADWLVQEEKWLGRVSATQLASRIVKSFSLFFDLASSLNLNLESGVTTLRGSRDRLTGLYNRQSFTAILGEMFDRDEIFGLMFIDMDTFKIYNDAVSHAFGDKLLIKLSNQMFDEKSRIRCRSLAGRFGGDEFCFAIGEEDQETFQAQACRLFSAITEENLETRFYLDDRAEGSDFDINLISFLHRLLRPDVGGVRGAGSEYAEEKGISPRERLVRLYHYYQKEINGNDTGRKDVEAETVVSFFCEEIKEKVLRNRIFNQIDGELSLVIKLFLELQIGNLTTDRIRSEIIRKLGKREIIRPLRIRISAGVAHSGEDRLRSVSSLFNAADGRAFMAKHNGRNGLFGLKNQRLI